MADFTPSKKTANDFNDGQKYVGYNPATQELGDYIEVETVNNLIESALYSQEQADSAKQTAQDAKDLIEATVQGQSIPPAIGLHHIQFSGEPTPAEIWAGTTWVIDTDYQGRSIIGSGGDWSLGNIGGNADAVVVGHKHEGLLYIPTSTPLLWGQAYANGSYGGISAGVEGNPVGTAYAGVDGTGKNMPPYKVVNYWKRTA